MLKTPSMASKITSLTIFAAKCRTRKDYYTKKYILYKRIALCVKAVMLTPPFFNLSTTNAAETVKLVLSVVSAILAGLTTVYDFSKWSSTYKTLAEIYEDAYEYLIDVNYTNAEETKIARAVIKEKMTTIKLVCVEALEPIDIELTDDMLKLTEAEIEATEKMNNAFDSLTAIKLAIEAEHKK